MIDIDAERKNLLGIRKMIATIEFALDEIKENANQLEDKLFDLWELEYLRRK